MIARVLAVSLLLAAAGSVSAKAPVYTLAIGPVNATDHELAECYFAMGHGPDALVITTHPRATSCVRLRELVGKSIALQAVMEER